MTIAVAIASHQRNLPLSIVLRNLPADWHAVVVLTDGEDGSAFARRPRTHVFHHANEPLGAKWQHAVLMARAAVNPDLLIIAGSDDVLLGDTDELVATMQGLDFLGLMAFLSFDGQHHWHCKYAPHMSMPIGGGRVYTRAILNRMRWRLFDTARNKHLDEYGYQNALRHGARTRCVDEAPGLQVVALKGPWPQKNPLDKYHRSRNIIVTPATHVRHRCSYQF